MKFKNQINHRVFTVPRQAYRTVWKIFLSKSKFFLDWKEEIEPSECGRRDNVKNHFVLLLFKPGSPESSGPAF